LDTSHFFSSSSSSLGFGSGGCQLDGWMDFKDEFFFLTKVQMVLVLAIGWVGWWNYHW